MRRRDFIKVVGSGAVAWPLAARAQQSGRVRRIGVLDGACRERPRISGLRGRVPGRTPETRVDGRPQHPTRLSLGALDDAELRQRSAMELVALTARRHRLVKTRRTTASMLQQTRTIPVVFVVVADPVGSGFVQNLARPGGNATGFTIMEPTITGKWLELLKEIAPRSNRAALLFNPATTPYRQHLPEPIQSRRCVPRLGGGRCNCSRQG